MGEKRCPRGQRHDARAEYQQVQCLAPGQETLRKGVDGCGGHQVHGPDFRSRHLREHGLCLRHIARGHDHPGAGMRQGAHRLAAQAGVPAGHDGHFALQVDARHDIGRGAVGIEARCYGLLGRDGGAHGGVLLKARLQKRLNAFCVCLGEL